MSKVGGFANNRYYSHPPRFQGLHCVRNRVHGGESYFVDSFAAAHDFASRHPDHAEYLVKRKIPFGYDNDGHFLSSQHAVLPTNVVDRDAAVNWSPPFQAMRKASQRVRGREAAEIAQDDSRFFDAIRAWEDILREPQRAYEFTMQEGDLVLFDNRRVLHARRGFRDLTEEERKERGVDVVPGEPTRWLKGCYLDGEVVWDKLVGLNRRHRSRTQSLEQLGQAEQIAEGVEEETEESEEIEESEDMLPT